MTTEKIFTDAEIRYLDSRLLGRFATVGPRGKRLEANMPFDPAWIRVRPRRILAWGIDGDSFELTAATRRRRPESLASLAHSCCPCRCA